MMFGSSPDSVLRTVELTVALRKAKHDKEFRNKGLSDLMKKANRFELMEAANLYEIIEAVIDNKITDDKNFSHVNRYPLEFLVEIKEYGFDKTIVKLQVRMLDLHHKHNKQLRRDSRVIVTRDVYETPSLKAKLFNHYVADMASSEDMLELFKQESGIMTRSKTVYINLPVLNPSVYENLTGQKSQLRPCML
ncbi:MAG: hypothetical protein FWF23_02940 [Alphaproteobacteria bacterium]|nr:hypothetical protein [Alphaproteobacteria bacterium]MCL2505489.1 hypothetical protein [Alphaproteobacteria bacterium]